jgi:hypothetical protein
MDLTSSTFKEFRSRDRVVYLPEEDLSTEIEEF